MTDDRVKRQRTTGWIAVDLDGTLAYYDHWRGPAHIGDPIPAMLRRVKKWVAEGYDVRIFTARCDGGKVALSMGNPDGAQVRDVDVVRKHIEDWCLMHVGCVLPITNVKDYGMIEQWDDRAVQVEPNTGRRVDGKQD